MGLGGDPPVLDQVVAVEEPEHGVRVAHVDREQHQRPPRSTVTLSISRVVPTRAATASSAGPVGAVRHLGQPGRVDQREVVEADAGLGVEHGAGCPAYGIGAVGRALRPPPRTAPGTGSAPTTWSASVR